MTDYSLLPPIIAQFAQVAQPMMQRWVQLRQSGQQ